MFGHSGVADYSNVRALIAMFLVAFDFDVLFSGAFDESNEEGKAYDIIEKSQNEIDKIEHGIKGV